MGDTVQLKTVDTGFASFHFINDDWRSNPNATDDERLAHPFISEMEQDFVKDQVAAAVSGLGKNGVLVVNGALGVGVPKNAAELANVINSIGDARNLFSIGKVWAFPMVNSVDEYSDKFISIGFEVHLDNEAHRSGDADVDGKMYFIGWCDIERNRLSDPYEFFELKVLAADYLSDSSVKHCSCIKMLRGYAEKNRSM